MAASLPQACWQCGRGSHTGRDHLMALAMTQPTERDLRAVARLRGETYISPDERAAARIRTAPAIRNGEDLNRVFPGLDSKDLRLRHWTLQSESNADLTYDITERPDTKRGGLYYHCTCPSWKFLMGRGTDCKHIRTLREAGTIR